MTAEVRYVDEFFAEMHPDVYGGESYEEHIPEWYAWGEGDKDGPGPVGDILQFDAKQWPAGTKLTIEIPCCPECEFPATYHIPLEQEDAKCIECGFDWREWTADRYS